MSDAFGLSLPGDAIQHFFGLFSQAFVRRWISSDDTQCTFRCISHFSARTRFAQNLRYSYVEHVSGTERRSYPLCCHLHLRDSRSPLRSRSDDLRLDSRFAHAHALVFLTPTRGSTPLTGIFDPLRSAAEPDYLSGGAGACRSQLSLLANKGPPPPTNQLKFCCLGVELIMWIWNNAGITETC